MMRLYDSCRRLPPSAGVLREASRGRDGYVSRLMEVLRCGGWIVDFGTGIS